MLISALLTYDSFSSKFSIEIALNSSWFLSELGLPLIAIKGLPIKASGTETSYVGGLQF